MKDLYKNIHIIYLLSLVLSFCILTYGNLFSQTDSIIVENISTGEGLSHRHVHCVMEDSYGFLWIGTDDGLNRYDGYEFVVYKNNIGDTTSLSSPIISVLTEDEKGNIWVGTPNGLNLYQRHSDSFVRYTHDPENEYSISKNDGIEALLIDRNNSNYVWIGTDGGGLNLFDIELQRFYSFTHDPQEENSLSEDIVKSLFQDSFGDFWIGTGSSGLDKINLSAIPISIDGKYDVSRFNLIAFEHFLNEQEDNEELQSARVYNIYEDSAQTLWVLLSGSGILNFDREKNRLIPSSHFIEQKYTHFHEMLEDRNGIFWFGSHNKVYQLNKNNDKIKEYILNKEGTRSSNNQGLCEDNAGNIWAATWDGIVRIHRDTPLFELHYHNVDDPSLTASNYMYSILADRAGKIWIGTYYGLLVMKEDINGFVRFINYSESHQINKGSVYSVIADHSGSIWAVIGRTLVRVNPQTNSIVQYKNDPENSNALSFQEKLGNAGSVNLLIDNDDNLWISAWTGGISKVSLEELYSTNNLNDVKFTNYFSEPNDPASSVLDFIQDRVGHLWICTRSGGVIKFDPETEIFKNYKQELNNPRSLNINWALAAHEDKKGNIWIGTYGGGLNKFNRETESFTHFGMQNGLPSDIIRGILGDDNGNLWISTHSGIAKFNPENNEFRNYYIQNNDVSFHDKLTGRMYFGDNSGFNVFHPDSLKESSFVPRVVLTKFTRYSDENNGEKIIDRTISAKDNIELSYKDDIISFEFAALSFNKNNRCEYSYKLGEFNNNWINIGTKRQVTFTNLDPGNYDFKVKACNEDGIWCENFASIHFYISPPWWSTWWSYGIYGLLFIGALYGIRRFEITRRIEKEDKRLLKIENERKTKELDQVRKLQLSMLPKDIPCLTNLDIAVYMKTATEVGGDYYDFYKSDDSTLTAVIGDATGHGLDAGMMVTAAKGLFQNLAAFPNLTEMIKQFNNTLISMHLQPMYMGVLLAKFNGNLLEIVGAGMTPLLLYRNDSDEIREIESSGPPLGAFSNYDYLTTRIDLAKGDVILLLSDGFEERFNSKNEMLGERRARELLQKLHNENADTIVEAFVTECNEWGGDRPQDDDVTFVVIKIK
ncbi:MAG: SpoIIE family protein phosphatase [Ignavibacteriaceae bacterium]|nr:SpoIIE family protein phosphatase [Ignavibacteria bacterium]NNJ52837.1 SpoIIE family protein phosphatase [Ignavibacteriaceae bacterium]